MSPSLKQHLTRTYLPVGTQYYRAPSPYPDQWEHDLQAIADLGFTMVKFWVQWRWNNPEEGKFDFGDIDRLMEIAEKNKLRVMLNTIVDVVPVWLYRKYPDLSMLTLDGRRIGPQVQPHRQIGGLGACFNHAEGMEHLFTFLRETVRHFREHPALEIWNVASEPELTSSMAEMRLYADDAEKIGDMLCFCDRCRQRFAEWLATKYGEIGRLNEVWNRNYLSFAEVEVPKTRNSFNDVIDWRMFFVHTLGQNVRRRFEVAAEEDAGRHALMCHHVFIQGFPVTSTANDPWNVGQYGDLHAITQMDDPMMSDVLRSCARNKPVISAEMLMLPGYTLDLPPLIAADDVKRYIFTGVSAGLKGFIFWQYRPEILAREAPAWGLTHLDGSSTPWLQSFVDVNRVLQRNAELLLDASPRAADVALLYSPENQIFGWAATGNEKNVTDSLLGAHRALYERNFMIDLVHPREFAAVIGDYRVLVMPFPYCLDAALCRALEEWVWGGGTVIAESYCAGWDLDRGRHQTTIPGNGLHKLFQARQATATRGDADGAVEIRVSSDLPFISRGERVVGAMVRETFFLDGATVLATHVAGEPAVVEGHYGKGRGILIGSYVAMPFHRHGHTANGALLASLVETAVIWPRPRVISRERVRLDMVTVSGGGALLMARNLEAAEVHAEVFFPLAGVEQAEEQFSGEELRLTAGPDGSTARLLLHPGEVKVYRA